MPVNVSWVSRRAGVFTVSSERVRHGTTSLSLCYNNNNKTGLYILRGVEMAHE